MQELSEAACRRFLAAHRQGVMALAEGGYSYAVPLFYAYDGQRVYFQSHPGMKDRYLERTAEACFVVASVDGDDDWQSVQVFGTVEKITLSDDAMAALDALEKVPFPPEFGGDGRGKPKRSPERMYLWMLSPARISGRASSTRRAQGEAGRARTA